MIFAPQRAAAAIGKAGCYFLCILRLAEKLRGVGYDPLIEYGEARAPALRYILDDCFVKEAGKLLGVHVGGTWRVLKAGNGLDSAGKPYDLPLDYELQEGELAADRYDIDGVDVGHFRLPDWDPLGATPDERWHLVSRRIFRRTA